MTANPDAVLLAKEEKPEGAAAAGLTGVEAGVAAAASAPGDFCGDAADFGNAPDDPLAGCCWARCASLAVLGTAVSAGLL